MKFSMGETMEVETTGRPLTFTPRFDITGPQVIVAGYADPAGRERLIGTSFGSMQWLWSDTDEVRFAADTRELIGVTLHVPLKSAPAQICRMRPNGLPPQLGGLRAATAEEFALLQTTAFCCTSDAAELMCLKDLDVLEGPAPARIGIASDVCLLVQEGAMVGWSLSDPARYLTDGFADPDTGPPAAVTRLRLAECLALVSEPLVDGVMDGEPGAWRSLRAVERALGEQREDRSRADVLHRLVSRLIEDYES
ncbi:hypothetical protein ACGFNV_08945 [Streptomyces sp. NPDC048751]|uniref:hypothetical protein n=1 Tax=Streptomyces sp. NPDC048751 TaxID=3365591 RepID=UPI00371A9BBD